MCSLVSSTTGQVLHYVRGQSDKRKRKDLLLSSNRGPFINRVLGRTVMCFSYGGLLLYRDNGEYKGTFVVI